MSQHGRDIRHGSIQRIGECADTRPHDFAQNRTSGIGKITAAVGRVGFARYGRKCFCAVVRSFRSSLQVFRSDGLRDEIAVDGLDARHPLSVVIQGADGCAAGTLVCSRMRLGRFQRKHPGRNRRFRFT